MDCYGHNFVIIGSILEILDVLSSPNRAASNFGTLCDKGVRIKLCVLCRTIGARLGESGRNFRQTANFRQHNFGPQTGGRGDSDSQL